MLAEPQNNTKKQKAQKLIPKDELNEEQLKKYEKYRSIRTQLATKFKTEAYNIFINNDLVRMAKLAKITAETLGKIPYINQHRVEIYGKYFIEISLQNEKS